MTLSIPAMTFLVVAGIGLSQSVVSVTTVEDGASFASRITPGSYVTIMGTNFTTVTQTATSTPFPSNPGGVSVVVNGVFCPISYVNPTQINFLLPWNTPIGNYPLTVIANGQTVGPTNITISSEAPGIFQYGANRAVAQNFNDNYSLNSPGAPAAVGSTLIVYVNGIGLVANTPADGAVSPTSPLAQGLYISSASIGGVNANVTFLGLTPGFVGLGQANITVPSLPSGDYPLILYVAGLESTSALVSVKGTGSNLPLVFKPIGSVTAPTSPLRPPLQGTTTAGATLTLSGNLAYLCDANGIAIIDVTNATSPKYLSNFGQLDLNGAGRGCAISQGALLGYSTGLLSVYDLTTPTSPQRIGQSQFFFGNTFLSGTMAYISTQAYNADASHQITSQTGDFYIYDMTNPALPKFDSQLVQNFSQPGSANTSPREGLTVFNNQTAIVLGTSATGASTNGNALWTTIDVSTPTKPAVLSQTLIPNVSIAVNLALQGSQALIAGNTTGVQNPPTGTGLPYAGNLTLTVADFANPLSGTIVSTLATPYQATSGYSMASLGKGFYAITIGPTLTDPAGPTTLAAVDARNPQSLVVYPEYAINGLQGIVLANGNLYAATAAGLSIFSVTLP
jgi:uncharacterized protein (TIGR03437 family)